MGRATNWIEATLYKNGNPTITTKENKMTSRDFAYWLQGFFEISEAKNITEEQTSMIKKHLGLVFKHEIDPNYGKDQEALNQIHNGDDSDMKFRC